MAEKETKNKRKIITKMSVKELKEEYKKAEKADEKEGNALIQKLINYAKKNKEKAPEDFAEFEERKGKLPDAKTKKERNKNNIEIIKIFVELFGKEKQAIIKANKMLK